MVFDWMKDKVKKAQQEVDDAITEKLDEEVLNPTLRQHKGEPPTDPQKDKG